MLPKLEDIKDLIEVYDVKAGRVLSKANEAKLRAAAEALAAILEQIDGDTEPDDDGKAALAATRAALDEVNKARIDLRAEAKAKQIVNQHIEEQAVESKAKQLAEKTLSEMNMGSKAATSVFVAGNTHAPAQVRDGGASVQTSKSFVNWLHDAKAGRVPAQKAMAEGTGSAGGFLVPPQYEQDFIELRRASSPLRGLVTVVPAASNVVYLPKHSGALTVAWTAENATKTASDETLAQVTVNIYTVAGIAKVSNQLMADSRPTVDGIIRQDLGRGIGIAEDLVMINGSGSGQPLGIVGTSGINTVAIASLTLADAIAEAILQIQTTYYGMPNAIVLHPRDVNKLLVKKETTGGYVFTQPGGPGQPNLMSLWGIPIIPDANIPTNLGAGTNETVAIVGNFSEAWLFEREGFAVDVSDVAGTSFEANQTWFRGEERIGFSAARQPKAFCTITGLTAAAGA